MDNNNEMELLSVLDDIRIVMAGKARCLIRPSEYEVVNESKQRLQNYGYDLVLKRAALKDVVEAQKRLTFAQAELNAVMNGIEPKSDEKEV